MFKKILSVVGIAAAISLGTAAAASAYPADVEVVAESATVAPGVPVTITATGLGTLETVTFSATGGSLASIVVASAGTSVDKPVADGTASAEFTATTPGTYTISVLADGEVLGSTTVTVAAAGSGAGGGSGSLPATGGTVPAAAIWVGVGALGLGAIAVAAVGARRRAAAKH